MEIVNKTHLTVTASDKEFTFFCNSDCLYGEAYDALRKMMGYVVDKIKESIPNEEKSEEKPLEEAS